MKLFPEAAERFVNESGSVRTSQSRKSVLATFRQLQGRHPDQRVDQFTTRQLADYILATGAPNTAKSRLTRIRSFYEWATWQKLVVVNPATDLKYTVKPGTGAVRSHSWLTKDQVSRVLEACTDDLAGRRDRILLLVGFSTGLRLTELSELRWSSFPPDLSTITLVGKGRKLATIGVSAQLRAELVAWRRQAPVGSTAVFPGVFLRPVTAEQGYEWFRPLSRSRVAQIVNQAGLRAGFDLSPHDLRRTYAGLLETLGVPVQDISRALRHGDVSVTTRYLEQNPARTVAVAGHLDAVSL